MPKKILIEFNRKIASVAEHCRDLGVKPTTVQSRHYRTGEPYEKCLEYYQKNGIRNHKKDGTKHKKIREIRDKRLYHKWWSTRQKCENPNHTAYPRYGKLGIKVCERWQNYENFENDMLESFLEHVEQYGIKDTTLDRFPDKMGDYEPNNVRWATMKEQANNKRNNRMITEDLTVAQFAEKYNIPYRIVLARLNAGWTIDKIINTPVKRIIILPTGERLSEFSKRVGIPKRTLCNKLERGWTLEQLIAEYDKDKEK